MWDVRTGALRVAGLIPKPGPQCLLPGQFRAGARQDAVRTLCWRVPHAAVHGIAGQYQVAVVTRQQVEPAAHVKAAAPWPPVDYREGLKR